MILFAIYLMSCTNTEAQEIIFFQKIKEVKIESNNKIKTKKIGNYSGITTNYFLLENSMQLITLVETKDTNLFLRNLTISTLLRNTSTKDSIIVKLFTISKDSLKPDDVILKFSGTISDFYEKANQLKFKLLNSYLKIPEGGYFISLEYYPLNKKSYLALALNKKNKVDVTLIKKRGDSKLKHLDYDKDEIYNLKTWFEAYIE
ncbi:MAG: hypothetical protein D8M25_13710 [Bacteroidetes bacterium]|nr:hypothetical protein [Bacteroidota bacterium]